jgi:hypothetical protein
MSSHDKLGMVEYKAINREIDLLLKRLAAKGICPCCVAQGLTYRGAFLFEKIAGTDETVALCLDIADTLDPDDGVTPVSDTQH